MPETERGVSRETLEAACLEGLVSTEHGYRYRPAVGANAVLDLLRDPIVRGGFITTCREELGDGKRCDQPAEFVLWGKLLPPVALGPRCYDHARDHTHWSMPSRPDQWAALDLRPLRALFSRPAEEPRYSGRVEGSP